MHPIDGQIRSFIRDNFLFGDTRREIATTDSLIENDIIDSTGVLELVMFAEECFGITVDDSEIVPDNFDSIENLRRYVASKTAEATAA